ncbi:Ubiquinone/menaquinone biosynthesis C-methylase UbiE [Devosia lucknowensis]|uniref:Ubiquinone/menaquinone biosynthesis C-methylase UbiE n=1 Tax=Devosia lucknowensis TaxID=1096929 RepID=A0A1Y6FQX2_9HYPH|nr:class I SAM-dependent methyltransferase [Devosia lucknowensis]SMQ75841.1 Ubiquinone/menaquinone biosynthesis C-methylase UbiE [Devosia lucknowensis]
MAEMSAFWDRLADRYAAQPIADETAYRTKLQRTRALLGPDMDIFEFGCGTGSTALTHAPYVRSVRGVDFSARMVEIARDKANASGITNVTFEQGDITAMTIPATSYDVVLGLSILHLLRDRHAVLSRVFDMLKPGGRFVSSTACLGGPLKLLTPVAAIGRALGKLPQIGFMSHAELRSDLVRAGFTIEQDWQPKAGAAVFIVARKPG